MNLSKEARTIIAWIQVACGVIVLSQAAILDALRQPSWYWVAAGLLMMAGAVINFFLSI